MENKNANDASDPDIHAFLLHTGELLHRYGTPSYRLESALEAVSQSVGVTATFLYTPTALVASLGENGGETTYLRRVDAGNVDIHKLLAFDRALEELEAGRLTVKETHERLRNAAAASPPFSIATEFIAGASVCGSVAVLFGGGIFDIMIAFMLGFAICALAFMAAKCKWENGGWVEPLSGFLVSLASLVFAQFLTIDHRITTPGGIDYSNTRLSLTIAFCRTCCRSSVGW